MSETESEYSSGTITEKQCPNCGRFVKIPKFYKPKFDSNNKFIGSFAKTKCKKCNKIVELGIEYL